MNKKWITIISVVTVTLFLVLFTTLILFFTLGESDIIVNDYGQVNDFSNNKLIGVGSGESKDLADDHLKFAEGTNINYHNGQLAQASNTKNNDLYINQIDNDYNVLSSKKIFSMSRMDEYFVDEIALGSYGAREHHEVWINGEYGAFLTSSYHSEWQGGLTDDDSIVIIKDNGTDDWEIINIISLQEVLGFTDEMIGTTEEHYLNATADSGVPESDLGRLSLEFIHANAFDYNYDSKRLFVSSRTLGAIIVINLSDIMNPELEMILSNPVTYNYMETHDGQNPIVKYDGTSDVYNWLGYTSNPDYVPGIKNEWVGKTLDYTVNGNKYNSDELFWDISEEYLFMGQHYVRSLNSFIEETGLIRDYDSTHEYISIFDNHGSQDNPYQLHWKNGEVGALKYDEDENGKWDEGAVITYGGQTYWDNPRSYFKVIDIDPSTMNATLISNESLVYSPYISNAQIFEIDGEMYVYSHSGATPINDNCSVDELFKFDSIDTNASDANEAMIGWKSIWTYDGFSNGQYRDEFSPNPDLEWKRAQGLLYTI